MATVLSSSAFSAMAVFFDVRPDVTAVCTANPVRFTCSRKSWSRPARRVAAGAADASVAAADELGAPVLGAIDIDELDDDGIERACCDSAVDEPLPLDVHAVVASARATIALPMATEGLRNGMGNP